jgi:hypothetical protein
MPDEYDKYKTQGKEEEKRAERRKSQLPTQS